MHRKIRVLIALLIFCIGGISASVNDKPVLDVETVYTDAVIVPQQIDRIQKEYEYSNIPAAVEVEEITDDSLSREDIELIALVTMAEAEGESEYGK